MWSASQSRSVATSRCSAHNTVPAGRRAEQRSTATERRRASVDNFVGQLGDGAVAPAGAQLQGGRGLPSGCGKSVVKRGRLVADAPRQP